MHASKRHRIFYIIIYAITALITLFAVLSIFKNAEIRYLKMLDFPRIQMVIALIILIIAFALIINRWKLRDYLLLIGATVGIGINGFFTVNYTPLVPVTVRSA